MTVWILSSSILILVIVSLRALLKGKIATWLQYALWLLVLVRLLVPGSLTASPISVANLLPQQEAAAPVQEFMTLPGTIQAGVEMDVPVQATVSPTLVTPEATPAPEPFEWGRLLKSLWIAGMLLVALALLGSNLSFYLHLCRSRKALDLDLPLPVYRVEGLSSPCLFGLPRPAIYVPAAYAEDRQAMSHMLAHEWSHYQQGDHIWSLLRSIAVAVHWYNPLVWLAAVLSKQDAELSCDAAAIGWLGEDQRLPYGRTLLHLITAKPRPADLLSCATTMTSGKRNLKQRISYIAKKPKMLAITAVLVILIAAAAVGCTFTGAEAAEMPDSEEPYQLEQDDVNTDPLALSPPAQASDPASLGNTFLSSLRYDGDREMLILPEGPYDGWTIRIRGTIPMDTNDMSYHDDFDYADTAGETGHSRAILLSSFHSAELELLCFDETGEILYDGFVDLLPLAPEPQPTEDLPSVWMDALGSNPTIQYVLHPLYYTHPSNLKATLFTEQQLAALQDLFANFTWTPYAGPSTVGDANTQILCASADGTQTLLFQEYLGQGQSQVRVYTTLNGESAAYDGSGNDAPITTVLLDLCSEVLWEAQGEMLAISEDCPTKDWGDSYILAWLTGLSTGEAPTVTYSEAIWVDTPDKDSGFRLDHGPEGQTLPLAEECEYWVLFRGIFPYLRLSTAGMQNRVPDGGLYQMYVQDGQVIAIRQWYIP